MEEKFHWSQSGLRISWLLIHPFKWESIYIYTYRRSVRLYLQYRCWCCIAGWQALKLGRFPTVNWKLVSFGTAIGFRLSVKKWHCPPGIGRSEGPDGRRVPLSTLSQQKQPQVITHSCCPASGQTIVSMTKRPWKAKDTSSSNLSLQNDLETIPQNISDSWEAVFCKHESIFWLSWHGFKASMKTQ